MNDSTPTGVKITTSAATNASYNKQEIEFITHEGAVSVGTRMIINSVGNVGIGTTTPGSKLQVYSTATRDIFISGHGTQAQNDWQAEHAFFISAGQGINIGKANANNNTNRLHLLYNTTNGDANYLAYDTSNVAKIHLSTKGDSFFNGGDVGIGTTSPTSPLTIKSNSTSSSSSGLTIQANGNTNDIFQLGEKSTDGSRLQMLDAGVVKIALYSDGTNNYINAGNVGIGETNPTQKLVVIGNIATSGSVLFNDNQGISFGNVNAKIIGSSADGIRFFGTGSEKMRLTQAGNVGINKTSPAVKLDVADSKAGSTFTTGIARFENTIETNSGGAGVLSVANNYQGGFGTLIKFYFEETSVASINFNASATVVVYNTTSDYRLKEDLKSFNGLEIIDQIKTYNYKWKKADARGYGALAHELQEVFPDAVTGDKDGEDMQGVDYSTLVPVLIKSIQELKVEIELLKQQINN